MTLASRELAYGGEGNQQDPWHERSHIQVMSALAQRGEEAAALDQYAAFSTILRQEFGIAERISAPGWRQSFIENEVSNRALVARRAVDK